MYLDVRPYAGRELVNSAAPIKLVEYDARCGWCAGRLIGVTLENQVPRVCTKSHKNKWREAVKKCETIGRYPTRDKVEGACAGMRAAGRTSMPRPWACRFCDGWHIKRHPSQAVHDTIPDDVQRTAHCRRCDQPFRTWNLLSTAMCSVLCLLKGESPERYESCWRRVPWATKATAHRATWRLGLDTGDITEPYLCGHCGSWHTRRPARLAGRDRSARSVVPA